MKRGVVYGSVLVVIGLVLFARAAGVPMPPAGLVLWVGAMALGLTLAVRGWKRQKRGRVFWGAMVAMVAGFALAMRLPGSGVTAYYLVPWIGFSVGISLLAAYLTTPRSLHLLVAALAVTILGCAVFLVEFGVLDRGEVVTAVKDYWAVVLILFGAGMLVPLRPFRKPESALRNP